MSQHYITRIQAINTHPKRKKFIGKNACLDIHGYNIDEKIIKIYTNTNYVGIGVCNLKQEQLNNLLGKYILNGNSCSINDEVKKILGYQTMAIWDLLGHINNKPVYKLLSNNYNKFTEVYDGSIYFLDLIPENKYIWKERLKNEIDIALELGHTNFKIKVGRGHKWMSQIEGFKRDIEFINEIYGYIKSNVKIGIDANNGYTLDEVKEFLRIVEGKVIFLEEMFPEEEKEYAELKEFILQNNYDILIADGESWKNLEEAKLHIESQKIDVLQANIINFGIEGILEEAKLGKQYGNMVAPHGWGTYLGYFVNLHLGKVLDNYYMAEHDPLYNDLVNVVEYKIVNGRAIVPNVPGFGFSINENKLEKKDIIFDIQL